MHCNKLPSLDHLICAQQHCIGTATPGLGLSPSNLGGGEILF
jgi:hypothetical protein